jgi:hypothetical protein
MTVVVHSYRTNLPHSVETRPWCIRTFGLWWSLVPTPASIVMSVPPARQEHLSLGRLARHLSLALPGHPVVCVAIHCLYPVRGEAQAEVNRQHLASLIARLAIGIAVGAQNDQFGAEVGDIWDHAASYQVEDATDTSAPVSEEPLEWDANGAPPSAGSTYQPMKWTRTWCLTRSGATRTSRALP